ncbi:MAG TPA: N-acetylornithine carbamoyltransferase [Elusimicrobia bacterium]|nr:N-acetylornithine carbamoyltransferase [Elusimicrobiota bacterium]HBT61101.1 N-acetylornithine carbamoyltransferase [Elusimicrobiota bacterium]
MKHFTHLHEHSTAELQGLVAAALRLKKSPLPDLPLAGRSVAFCFMNPSLRTQVSFEVATAALGGHPVVLSLGQDTWKVEHREGIVMDGPAAEHLKEAVPVLARYCQAVALRSFPEGKSWQQDKLEPFLRAFRKYSEVPVINLESATSHPCQGLADLMTIQERMEPRRKNFLLTWAPHIKGLPQAVPASAAEAAAAGGMNVTIARPEGYDLDPEIMQRIARRCDENHGQLKVTDQVPEAYDGAHVVYAKSWGSISRYGEPPPQDAEFRRRWMVTAEKMRRTQSAFFMHCLPVRRNLIVEDAVLDSPASIVIDQAENRLHTSKAVLLALLASQRQAPQESLC